MIWFWGGDSLGILILFINSLSFFYLFNVINQKLPLYPLLVWAKLVKLHFSWSINNQMNDFHSLGPLLLIFKDLTLPLVKIKSWGKVYKKWKVRIVAAIFPWLFEILNFKIWILIYLFYFSKNVKLRVRKIMWNVKNNFFNAWLKFIGDKIKLKKYHFHTGT